jgi:hypothetical protein
MHVRRRPATDGLAVKIRLFLEVESAVGFSAAVEV